MRTDAVWTNGKSERKGAYEWIWHANTFRVWLDKPVGYGGEKRKSLSLLGYETPEWGKWRLVK